MNFRTKLLALVFAAAFGSTAHAQLNFYFTIVGDPSFSTAAAESEGPVVSGTITGEIFGLQDNTNDQIPTDVVIFSAPAGFTDSLGFSAPPNYSLTDNGWTRNGGAGFDVEDGQIQSDSSLFLLAYDAPAGLVFNYEAFDSSGQINGLISEGPDTANEDGFSGVLYTPAVPEPSQWGEMVFLGVLAFVGLRRVRSARSSLAA